HFAIFLFFISPFSIAVVSPLFIMVFNCLILDFLLYNVILNVNFYYMMSFVPSKYYNNFLTAF
ncbi:hypothetical protein ACJX0J_013723, partial [Zea mays]